jgi:hypothetical protein
MKNIKKLQVVVVWLLIFLAVSTLANFQVYAQGASVWTDKADYHLGETVTIYGTGFQHNCNIEINVTAETYKTVTSLIVISDTNGNFEAIYTISHGGIRVFDVTATDGTNTAGTTFTDCDFPPPTCIATIYPVETKVYETKTYVIQILNLKNTPSGYSAGILKSANITIPSGFSNVNVISANHFDYYGNLISTWNYGADTSQIWLWESNQGCDDVTQGQYVNVTFSGEAPATSGIFAWTTYVYSDAPSSCPFIWPSICTSLGTIYGQQPTITVNNEAVVPTQFEVTAETSQVAGTPFLITVIAEDQCENKVTEYNGTIHFTSSDDNAVLPLDYTFQSTDNGMQTFEVTLETAGSQSITITDSVDSSITGSLSGITVSHASAQSIIVYPQFDSITAGNTELYTAVACDTYGNTWDVTYSVVWSISPEAGGSWSNNIYTSAKAGTWVVTAINYAEVTGKASLTVTSSSLDHIKISPISPIIEVGSSQLFNVKAFDLFGNSLGDVTSLSIFTAPGATVNDNSVHANLVGSYTVTATYTGKSDSTILTAVVAGLDHIRISPISPIVIAGSTQAFTVQAYNAYGTSIADVTDASTFSVNGVLVSGNFITETSVGTYLITVSYGGKTDHTILTVIPGPLFRFTLDFPVSAIAGVSFSGKLIVYDAYNNVKTDYVGTAHFTSSDSASGVVLPSDYTFASGDGGSHTFTYGFTLITAGTQILTVTDSLTSGSDSLVIIANKALVDYIVISPKTATIPAGQTQLYIATAYDIFGNSWDISNDPGTVWSINSGDGTFSWTGNSVQVIKVGIWTVTASFSGASDNAFLTVTHAIDIAYLDHISASVNPTIVAAPNTVTGTATAFDTFGNSWDVSTVATWSIPADNDGGSWLANVYTSKTAGTYTVQAKYEGKTANVSLTVTHATDTAYLDRIVAFINPILVAAPNQATGQATAYDNFGNGWDVSTTAAWAIVETNDGGSWNLNVYTSHTAGSYFVKASYQGKVATASLTVTHSIDQSKLSSIAIAPLNSTVAAGQSQSYLATAADAFGNMWDVTSNVSAANGWSIPAFAGGSWVGATYMSSKAGVWIVTGTYLGMSGTANLTVTHATDLAYLDHIVASMSPTTVSAPNTATGMATAYDSFGNKWDISTLTAWSIPAGGDGGLWTVDVYTSHTAGTYSVLASYLGKTAYAALTVTHASDAAYLDHIVIAPKQSIVAAGVSQSYTATAYDTFGNSWDVTGLVAWSIDIGAGGSWNGATYISSNLGTWTVKASLGTVFGTATLTVNAFTYQITVNQSPHGTIAPGTTTVTAGATPSFTITPDAGYHIASISTNGQPVTVTNPSGQNFRFGAVSSDGTLTATFAINSYSVIVYVGNDGSTNIGNQTVNWNAKLNFIFTPDLGNTVSNVEVNRISRGGVNTLNLTITGNTVIDVSFAIKTYVITVIQSANGVISPGTTIVNFGANQTFTITQSNGYYISSLTVDNASAKTGSLYTFTNVQGPHSITASFASNETSVTLGYVIDAFIVLLIIIIIIMIIVFRRRKRKHNKMPISEKAPVNDKQEIDKFKITIEKIKGLETEKEKLMLELEELNKAADAKAAALESEVGNLRGKVKLQKDLMGGEKPDQTELSSSQKDKKPKN